MTYNSAVKSER